MPRTALPITTATGAYPGTVAANAADFTWQAGDATNLNSFVSTGAELLLVRNDNASAQTVSVLSVADSFARTGDITSYSVDAGEYATFGPFPTAGWRQSDGTVHIDPSHTDLKFAVVKLG